MVVSAASLVTDPLDFVVVVALVEAALSVQSWRGIRDQIDWRRIGWLLAGAAVGLPIGLWALTSVPEDVARGMIAAFVLIMCGVLAAGLSLGRVLRGPVNGVAGGASGLANACGMGGLPVAAYLAAQPIPAAVFRATLIGYFPLLDALSLPLYWSSGLISAQTAVLLLWALPLSALGNWLGSRHFLRVAPQGFRRFVLALLAVLGGAGLVF